MRATRPALIEFGTLLASDAATDHGYSNSFIKLIFVCFN
jgi:hypothetical protein